MAFWVNHASRYYFQLKTLLKLLLMTFDYPTAGALFYRWKNHCCYASSPRSQAFVRQRSGTQHRRDGCICSLPTGRYFNINFFAIKYNHCCRWYSMNGVCRFQNSLLLDSIVNWFLWNQILVFQMPIDSKLLCQLHLPNCSIFHKISTVYPWTFLWQLKILTRPYRLVQFC